MPNYHKCSSSDITWGRLSRKTNKFDLKSTLSVRESPLLTKKNLQRNTWYTLSRYWRSSHVTPKISRLRVRADAAEGRKDARRADRRRDSVTAPGRRTDDADRRMYAAWTAGDGDGDGDANTCSTHDAGARRCWSARRRPANHSSLSFLPSLSLSALTTCLLRFSA